ncbi:MAG: sugar MFS transporter, partial [Bacteroidales bacterium]|nr:sugar MFS transporter [Bacteroidales bacterium]
MEFNPQKRYTIALTVLTLLFFIWGFLTVLNDILIPYLKKIFELNYFEVMFIQFAFFGAYFIGSLVYFIISTKYGDPISRIGYKKGILIGLLISTAASLMFYPAAALRIFPLFLIALFVLGLGFTLLQISANPYVAILGPQRTASSRLNLAQAFNSLGTTVAPIFGGWLIFSFFGTKGKALLDSAGKIIYTDDGGIMSAMGIQLPYLLFAGVLILLFFIVLGTKLPKFVDNEKIKKDAGALKHKNLVFGMIAIFFYVGAEVSIGSLMINFFKLPEIAGIGENKAKLYLAFYWGGAMIGRFLGAISLSDSKIKYLPKPIIMLFVSLFTFLIIWFFASFENTLSVDMVLPFLIFIAINLIGFILGRSKAHTTLFVFALIIIALLTVVLSTNGHIAFWSLIGIGLFNSIMWSNIFTLAIKDLKEYTSQGSSLLVMAILGGALIPLAQGATA